MNDKINDFWTYHAPTGESVAKHQAIRSATASYMETVEGIIPKNSRNRAVAVTHIETALMFLNKAIAFEYAKPNKVTVSFTFDGKALGVATDPNDTRIVHTATYRWDAYSSDDLTGWMTKHAALAIDVANIVHTIVWVNPSDNSDFCFYRSPDAVPEHEWKDCNIVFTDDEDVAVVFAMRGAPTTSMIDDFVYNFETENSK